MRKLRHKLLVIVLISLYIQHFERLSLGKYHQTRVNNKFVCDFGENRFDAVCLGVLSEILFFEQGTPPRAKPVDLI